MRPSVLFGSVLVLVVLALAVARHTVHAQQPNTKKNTGDIANVEEIMDLARELYEINPDSSIRLMETLIIRGAVGPGLNKPGQEADVRKTLSTALYLTGQNARALIEGKKAVQLFAEADDTTGLGVAHANLGMIYFGLSLYNEAATQYGTAQIYLRNRGKESAMAGISNNLGNLWMVQEKYEEALKCYEGALKTYRQLNIPGGVSYTINNIGVVNEKKGKYPAAIDCYRQALAIDERENDLLGVVNANLNLGDVFTKTGRLPFAVEAYQKALDVAEQISDQQGIISALTRLAEYNFGGNQNTLAHQQARRALEMAEESGISANLEEILELLSEISAARGDHRQSARYQKQRVERLLEMHRQQTELTERNAREQATIRALDARQENQQLKSEMNATQSILNRTLWINGGLGIGLLLLLVIHLKTQKNNRRTQNQLLEERERREKDAENKHQKKLHETQDALYQEQKIQAQNLTLFLREISGYLNERQHRVAQQTPGEPGVAEQIPGQPALDLRGFIEDLMVLMQIQHNPGIYPPAQTEVEILIKDALINSRMRVKVQSRRKGLMVRTIPILFHLMLRNLTIWVETRQNPAVWYSQVIKIELGEPEEGVLPIQMTWADYVSEAYEKVRQSIHLLSNRRFDWPAAAPGQPAQGSLALVHQSLQQIGGRCSLATPPGQPSLAIEVQLPLQG